MTVIAIFEGLGIGISDLLMSRDVRGKWMYLPSLGEPPDHIQQLSFSPTRLVRKVGYLAVGASATQFLICGTVAHAESFLKTAQELVSGKLAPPLVAPLNRDDMASVLTHAAEFSRVKREADFAALAFRGVHSIIVGRTIRVDLPYFGKITLGGSGAPALEEFLRNQSYRYQRDFGDESDFGKGIRVAHHLPMQLLAADRRNPSITLSKGVGGFYEVWFNLNSGLGEDDMGWVRILADVEPPYARGVTVRALWWHAYAQGDLVVASAPCEESFLAPGATVLIPKEKIKVDRFPTFTDFVQRQPPSIDSLLPKIVRAKFFTSSLSLSRNGNDFLATTMATRNLSVFQISWDRTGIRIKLDKDRFLGVIGALSKASVFSEPSDDDRG